VQARIPKVVIGCMNKKAGCAGSIINMFDIKQFNHQVETVRGILEDECSELMIGFFSKLRQKQKTDKTGE
jgi:tRNA(adenine34) deaminase